MNLWADCLLVAWIYHPVPHIGREPGEGYTRLSAEERLAETWRRLLARNKLPRVATGRR